MKKPQEDKKQQDMFEELSVKELEDRLELVDRCVCRVGPKN